MTVPTAPAADRASIENVLAAYALAYDDNDMETMADCFTADAVLTMRIQDGDLIGPFEGREAIVRLMRDSLASQNDQRRHLVTNVVIRAIDADIATVDSYLTLISVTGSTLTVLSTARYADELVRDSGHWRFGRRHIQLDLPY
ncbi:nuclear transport factor 2 family protein [Prauserella oleivorans]|uniref:Nuclear transport factor 2 family protein n=1 Tax=Prauserella oleivorans TaxID=1478153 RepID=A0ABW5W7E2_9PSEU